MTLERNGREAWPPELTDLLRKVDRLRRAGRYAEALERMNGLVEHHPRQVRVLLEMGLTLAIWGGLPADALPWYERALALAPGHASAHLHRALALARLGRHAEAVADFDALAADDFRKPLGLHMTRAQALYVLGRPDAAERDWTRALDEDPANPWLLHRRALVRARMGRTPEALEDLTRALATAGEEPVDAELLRDRGRLRARLGDPEGARADFEAGRAALREGDPAELRDSLHHDPA
ncbi:MAG: tetratricopeptide repeat protein [Cystobacter sp.]